MIRDDVFRPSGIGHTENGDRDPAEIKAAREGLLDTLLDIQVEFEDTARDRDQVVVRWQARGTHLGAGLGMPATGRPADFRGMTWLTFRNGTIVEDWDSGPSFSATAVMKEPLAPRGGGPDVVSWGKVE